MVRPATSFKYKIILLTIFAMAMAYLEAIVVVYIRTIAPPEIFKKVLEFATAGERYRALVEMVRETKVLGGWSINWTEQTREAATIVMLFTVSALAGRRNLERLSFFLWIFGIWDIFYYIWLKVLIGWPESFLDWDVLFLIPVPWVAPVFVPLLASALLLTLAIVIFRRLQKGC